MSKKQKGGTSVDENLCGLSSQEAEALLAAGEGNTDTLPPTKSVKAIFRDNLLTPFNLLNLALAILVILAGSWKNALFMGVILSNVVIGTVQELRAKAVIDKLSLIAAPHAKVVRDGRERFLALEELVRGDLVKLGPGDQVGADCVVAQGLCQMDESLLTGESEPVERGVGETLFSGSYLVSGHCLARVIHVGGENYAAKITAGAKYIKRPRSEIMDCVNRIIRYVGYALGPVGLALFVKQCFFTGHSLSQAVVATVAALVGMIPEGLVLLTSMVLAVSVVRLSGRGALAQELHSVEMLARVDTLCLDKTGTLTTGEFSVAQVVLAEGFDLERVKAGLAALLAATGDENPTGRALRAYAGAAPDWEIQNAAPFRSARKWSGGSFDNGECWVMGAAEMLFPQGLGPLEERRLELAQRGLRVVALGWAEGGLTDAGDLPEGLVPVGLVALSDTLRPSAAETLEYFRQQGVELKIISGDDPRTVADLARQAGFYAKGLGECDAQGSVEDLGERDARQSVEGLWIDASTLQDEAATKGAAEEYAIFGRVTPQQKLWLVQALQAGGHTVAMTGDGVNDVLALRESDCGVAMAAGSEAARNVSQIVLMDSDFSAMPAIVDEGRRAINNLQRSAALFLTKTCFSVILAVCFLFLPVGYPFQPIQLTLISALTIGAPSFLLALEPNFQRVQGRFRDNVFSRALPGGVAMATDVLWCVALMGAFSMTAGELSTVCVLLVGFAGLVNLAFVSAPLNRRRGLLLGLMTAGFCLGVWLWPGLFALAIPLPARLWTLVGALAAWTVAVQALLQRLAQRRRNRAQKNSGGQ